MITRRHLVALALAAALAEPAAAARADRKLKAIHKRIGGRLGVHVLDSQSGRRIGYDENSRYAMASTFKMLLAATILWQVDRGAFPLTQTLPIASKDVVPASPALEAALAAGAESMTVQDLCKAIVTRGDNGAANILLGGIGGPATLTRFMRSIGDEVTRLDRMEPDLNSNNPGDPRDTTTPRAMVDSMLRIFTQDIMSLPARAMLIDWMNTSSTGLDRVRAGMPPSWEVGDKTGTGQNNAVNDVAIAYPPERRPILIAVYMSESTLPQKELHVAHAEIGRIIAEEKWP